MFLKLMKVQFLILLISAVPDITDSAVPDVSDSTPDITDSAVPDITD